MFLHGVTAGRLRRCSAVLAVAFGVGCIWLVPSVGAAEVRHYEQVTPAQKGQGDIVADGDGTVASDSGDAAVFASRTPFGDEIGSGASGQTQYIGRRAGDGWTVHAITPAPQPDALQILLAATVIRTFSADLRTAVVWAYDLPAVSNDTPARDNIYVEDTATRGLQPLTVSQADPLPFPSFASLVVWGVSADARHVAFVSPTRMLPNAALGAPNVYQWDNGVLSLAGILPDGTVPAGGSNVVPQNYRGAMSADGSRLVFTAAPNGNRQLYMRIDGRRTVWISQPEGSDTADPTNVSLQAVTPDGHTVFFVTDAPLLDSDTNGGPDIYRYTDSSDPAHDSNLTLVSHDGNVPGNFLGTAVVGVSDDGNRVYYLAGDDRLMVWDAGASRLIAYVQKNTQPGQSIALTDWGPGLGRVTPDGMWLAFATNATLGNDQVHGLKGQVTNGHVEMYLYSLKDDSLTCVSCPSDVATGDVLVSPDATSGAPQISYQAFRPRFLSDDGKVFFSTVESLVPGDRNGVEDVYEYDPTTGGRTLISTGKGSEPASFADASTSGDNVFILTRQQLVPSDQDNLVDLYDVRVGPAPPGGVPARTAPCDGDSCQPAPSAAPGESPAGTLSFIGASGTASSGRMLAIPRSVLVRGPAGGLRIRLFGPGTVKWNGTGVLAGSANASRSGTYVLRVRLNRHARAQLRRRGRVVTRIRVTVVLPNGTSASGITRVTFRAAAKKGR